MPKSGQYSGEDTENTLAILCDQYLPRVFQYIRYWISDTELAEELTTKAIKKAQVKFGNCCNDEPKFSARLFMYARNEIRDYSRENTCKPILPGLSVTEQEVISLKLAAVVNNGMISKLLGLPESKVSLIVSQSLGKLGDYMEVLK